MHHYFHADEHVHEKSHREFKGMFKTSRHDDADQQSTDDYLQRRNSVMAEKDSLSALDNNNSGTSSAQQHKLAGLKCQEKFGGPDDAYAEREMAFWSDIPTDASYKSPFMEDGTERFLTFEP